VLDDVSPQERLRLLQPRTQWMLRFDVDEHFPDLAHQINGLVECHDQIAFGQFYLGADLGHGGATRPGARGAIKVGIVPLGDGQSFAALLAQHSVLDVLYAAAGENESIW
jgi:hypothetical protein